MAKQAEQPVAMLAPNGREFKVMPVRVEHFKNQGWKEKPVKEKQEDKKDA